MHRLPNGQLVPDAGEVPMWDGTEWIFVPPIPGPPGPRGGGGGMGMRGPAGPPGPAGPAGDSLLIQEVYGENQARPTVYDQAAPGGVFQTVLTVNITTTTGTYLAIEAFLSALTDGGVGSTETESSIRILADGISLGLGSTETHTNINNALEPFVALSLTARYPLAPVVLAPGLHTIELQWMIQGDGAANKSIGFLSIDQDGCAMFVREMVE